MRNLKKRTQTEMGAHASLHNTEGLHAAISTALAKALHMHDPHQSIPQMNLHF
jgi:hypothetical protein